MMGKSKGCSHGRLVVCHGNSITNGGASKPLSYPQQLQPLLETHGASTVINQGHDGYTVEQLISAGTEIPVARVAAAETVAILWEATNSIWFGTQTTLDGLWAQCVAWSAVWRAAGVSKIIMPNVIARVDFSEENEALALAFNSRLASARLSEVADATVDMRTIFPDYSDETKFADGIHPTTYGYGLIAAACEPSVREQFGI